MRPADTPRFDEEAVAIMNDCWHLTKSVRSKSIYRGMGSIDLTAAARSVVLVGTHPEKGTGMCHIKSNLAPLGPSLGYTLDAGKF